MKAKRLLLVSVFGAALVGAALAQPGSWQRVGPAGAWKGTLAGVVLNDRLYTAESNGGLYATDPDTGKWKQVSKAEFGATTFLFAVGDWLYTIETDGSLYRVSPADGSWQRVGPAGAWKGTLAGAVLNGRLYTAESDGGLYETDLDTGEWKRLGKKEFGNTTFLFAAGGWLSTIEADGSLYRVEAPPTKGDPPPDGKAPAASAPQYVIESTVARRVTAVFRGEFHASGFTPEEWTVITALAPELPSQAGVKTTLDPEGKPTPEADGEHRQLLVGRAKVEHPVPDGTLTVSITYEATLLARHLAPVKPGQKVKSVPPLEEEERERYLAPTYTLDFQATAFQEWLDRNQLRRQSKEGDVEFGRRVFKLMLSQFTYERTKGEKVSELCQMDKADCDTLSSVFAAALRANGIPARVLFGYLAESKKPDAEGRIAGHAIAEFFADGVGWVPADVAFALGAKKKDPMSYFGDNKGNLLVQHVDSDIMVAGDKQPSRIYGLAFPGGRARGKTKGKIEFKPLGWDVEVMPEAPKQGAVAPWAAPFPLRPAAEQPPAPAWAGRGSLRWRRRGPPSWGSNSPASGGVGLWQPCP
jgi:hypothetical protein